MDINSVQQFHATLQANPADRDIKMKFIFSPLYFSYFNKLMSFATSLQTCLEPDSSFHIR